MIRVDVIDQIKPLQGWSTRSPWTLTRFFSDPQPREWIIYHNASLHKFELFTRWEIVYILISCKHLAGIKMKK